MKKHLLFLFFYFLLLAQSVEAQTPNRSVSGTLIDSEAKETLIGGHVMVQNLSDSTKYFAISNVEGLFKIDGLKTGNYFLKVSYIGFKPYEKNIQIQGGNLDLGKIPLVLKATNLDMVEIKALQIRAIQKGDTTEFNAAAYKTNVNANVEDLITKMPGVVVENGEVSIQGEKVAQVLIDGKPYFTNDPSAALKNLPSEVVSKIQVFDQESEESQGSGVTDGETVKTINIILKKEFKNSIFGNVYGGYGTDDTYALGGNVNFFDGNQKITLLGQSNNINIQNFSSADLLGVVATTSNGGGRGRRGGRRGGGGRGGSSGGNVNDFLISPQGGLTSTNAFGMNYQNTLGKLDISGSYFFNHSDNNNESGLFENYLNTDSPTEYFSNDTIQNTNLNHRLNLRLQYKPSKQHQLTYIPSFTYQGNSGTEKSLAETFINNLLSNQVNQSTETDYSALDFQHRLIYSYRMNKKGRRLSLNVSQGMSSSDGENMLNYTSIIGLDTALFRQFSTLNSKKDNWRAGFSFSEPISKRNSLYTRYNFSHSTESYDRFTYDEEASDAIISELSNVFETKYQTHKIEIGNQYRTKKVSLTARLGYQVAQLDNTQEFPSDTKLDNTFKNFLPSVRFRYKVSDSKNLRMDYRSSTQIPSVTNFQEVINNSNPLQLETGNGGLEQQTNHSVRVRYSANNTDKATVFFTYLNVQLADEYISNATYLATSKETFRGVDLDEGVQLSYPTNLSGYFSTRAFMSYGIPLEKIKSNLNINLDASYNRIPNLFNEQKNFIDNQKMGLGLVLGSNISEKVDFTLSSRSTLDLAKSDFSEDNQVFSQISTMKLVCRVFQTWQIESDFSQQYYNYTNDDITTTFSLWGLGISRFLTKDNRLQVSLKVFDLLNQNRSVQQAYTEYSFQQTESLNLNRYYMVSLRYNFKSFKQEK